MVIFQTEKEAVDADSTGEFETSEDESKSLKPSTQELEASKTGQTNFLESRTEEVCEEMSACFF